MTAFVSKHHSIFSLDRTVAFSKARAGLSIFEASKKIPKRGARSVSPPALHRLAGGNGPPYSPKFSKARAGLSIFEASKKIPKRGARSVSHHALHGLAGGNGPPCFPTFSKARAGQHFCVQKNSKAGSFGLAPRGAMTNHASFSKRQYF